MSREKRNISGIPLFAPLFKREVLIVPSEVTRESDLELEIDSVHIVSRFVRYTYPLPGVLGMGSVWIAQSLPGAFK
ncbi:hypothetical protein NMY22_g14018 [Coprinellus aureogranulatus]|nr:hypothetical protein NMY22_g14018 [Coprinellus aureogranulatus]